MRAAFLLLLIALPASAQRVRFALHPINAPSIEDAALVRFLDNEANNQLTATRRFTLVNADDVRAQLADDGGRCPARLDERIRCLERLALTTRAVYSLEIEAKRLGKTYELTATIAAANRTVLKQPESVSAKIEDKAKTKEKLRDLLIELLVGKLKVQDLALDPKDETSVAVVPPPVAKVEPVPPVAKLEPAPVTQPPTVIIERETDSGPKLRPAAYAVGAVAVALGITSLAFGLSSASEANTLTMAHPNQTAPFVLHPGEEDTASSLRTKRTVSLITGIGAGAAAVTAVVLFVVSGKKSPALSFSPTFGNNTSGVALSGEF